MVKKLKPGARGYHLYQRYLSLTPPQANYHYAMNTSAAPVIIPACSCAPGCATPVAVTACAPAAIAAPATGTPVVAPATAVPVVGSSCAAVVGSSCAPAPATVATPVLASLGVSEVTEHIVDIITKMDERIRARDATRPDVFTSGIEIAAKLISQHTKPRALAEHDVDVLRGYCAAISTCVSVFHRGAAICPEMIQPTRIVPDEPGVAPVAGAALLRDGEVMTSAYLGHPHGFHKESIYEWLRVLNDENARATVAAEKIVDARNTKIASAMMTEVTALQKTWADREAVYEASLAARDAEHKSKLAEIEERQAALVADEREFAVVCHIIRKSKPIDADIAIVTEYFKSHPQDGFYIAVDYDLRVGTDTGKYAGPAEVRLVPRVRDVLRIREGETSPHKVALDKADSFPRGLGVVQDRKSTSIEGLFERPKWAPEANIRFVYAPAFKVATHTSA